MSSARFTNRTPSRRWSLSIIALVVLLVLIAASTLPGNRDPALAAQPTWVPPTRIAPTIPAPPTWVPPTRIAPTIPAPPTWVPPTRVPPTEVPPTWVPPTVIPPTEIPPTAEPPTEEPPTETPPPFPASPTAPAPPPPPPPPPPPTQPPAGPVDAGEIDLLCTTFDSQATPIAEPGDWALQLCTIPLGFGAIDSLDARATSSDPGWRVILTQPDAAQTPGLLNASNNRTVLNDLAGESEATFLLGTQPTCSALGNTTLVFSFTGSQETSTTTVDANAELDFTTPPVAAPELQMRSATFTGNQGTITIDHGAALANSCPWQVTVTLPGARVNAVDVTSGTDGATAVPLGEAIVVTLPPGSPAGELTLAVEVTGSAPDALLLEGAPRP